MTETPPDVTSYAWPAVPVTDAEVAAVIMAARLQAAWDDLEAERVMVATSLTMGRKALVDATLREFQAALAAFMEEIETNVERFLALHIGPRYAEGVRAAFGAQVVWTEIHELGLTSLAIDTYDDVLQRAREAERVSEAFVRAVRAAAAVEVPKLAAGGRTARQAADRLEARLLTDYGITHVTYRNGADVPVRTWAQMAARTKSAVAYSSGTLNATAEAGVGYVEVFDGTECGWTSHDDPDKANGTVRPVADAGRYVISHPQCQRAFGPRPDVTTDLEARAATASTTPEQRADQATVDYRADRPNQRRRATQVRRARTTARRQARQLGVSEPEQVGVIIARILKERGLT